ncbi:SGNH/GDSL hydrolase family protein [Flavobacterium agri]|nr:SGNH/GDSL hydrolase family protein [Flavobacterium agri]
MMIRNFKWLVLASLTLAACSDDDSASTVDEPITAGSADLSKYVALGDSFAAGYSDNALFKKGQENSYPNIIASQFALAGGGSFAQPLMVDNVGGFSMGGVQISAFPTRLYFNGTGPANVPGVSGTVFGTTVAGPFNNFGVPGAKSFHLGAAGYGTLNPYFGRFASSATASPFSDALAQNPTFFTLWIGGNDVLAYATSGGTGTNQTGNFNPATYGGNDITDPTVFDNVYNSMIDGLTANGAKGAVGNLPYVNTLPFFTTVPYNPVPLDATTATTLNTQLLGPLKQILTALGEGDRINLVAAGSTNPLLIVDQNLTNYSAQITGALMLGGVPGPQATLMGNLYGQARHAKKSADGTFRDFILLPTRNIIGTTQAGVPAPFNTVGVTYPLQDAAVLTNAEAGEVRVATDAYNITIEGAASAHGLALFDSKATLNQLLNGGIRFGNYHMTTSYVTGGAFSLDGIHPSARGYALIANRFLEAINATYGSNFKGADLGDYQIQYPVLLP